MKVGGKVVVVTGGGAGIGKALCERFHREGAKAVVVVDRDAARAAAVASAIGGTAMTADVTVQTDVTRIVDETESRIGPIGLFCSNAGVLFEDPDWDDAASDTTENWMRGWGLHVMAHVFAAKALIPRYKARGGGHFLQTISAAGLLSAIGGGVYSTTKHAAIGFAEHLAITHREHAIGVSILCPQAVDTDMIRGQAKAAALKDGVITPEQVADAVMKGLAEDRFLILPHPDVLGYMQKKTADYDRWIAGMVRLRAATRPSS